MNCDGFAVVVVKYTAGRVPDAAPLFNVRILAGLLAGLLAGYGLSVAVDATTLIVTYSVVVLLVVQVEYVSVSAGVVTADAVTGQTVV